MYIYKIERGKKRLRRRRIKKERNRIIIRHTDRRRVDRVKRVYIVVMVMHYVGWVVHVCRRYRCIVVIVVVGVGCMVVIGHRYVEV